MNLLKIVNRISFALFIAVNSEENYSAFYSERSFFVYLHHQKNGLEKGSR